MRISEMLLEVVRSWGCRGPGVGGGGCTAAAAAVGGSGVTVSGASCQPARKIWPLVELVIACYYFWKGNQLLSAKGNWARTLAPNMCMTLNLS